LTMSKCQKGKVPAHPAMPLAVEDIEDLIHDTNPPLDPPILSSPSPFHVDFTIPSFQKDLSLQSPPLINSPS
jgi:hypothetical protein